VSNLNDAQTKLNKKREAREKAEREAREAMKKAEREAREAREK
jgi:hypothetical protein